ncbi:hypothetical protein PQO03_03900 [Lentisphaera profundi]|uniref:Chemotaxis methyl-accepting receptor HlyB-like 4HB MCP domain-containing protein n=1 Tax=Lentisphaera profundi TaxID=1658616 RepID=A0ABY7VTL4_9BACT|nr:hypothetical protein [Lentisphaera profundi]WDE97099.1 hypothetical protein PQO03_03900 [Lentisphaera profundi]
MKNLNTLNFYTRNIKVLSSLMFLFGLILSGLEIANYISKLKASAYATSHQLGNESEKLHTELKAVEHNISGILKQFGEEQVSFRKVNLYKSYRNLNELEGLNKELKKIDKDLLKYKDLFISALNKDLEEILSRIEKLIVTYKDEGLIEDKPGVIIDKDFQPVYGPKALEKLSQTRANIDTAYTYVEELAAQMDIQENRALAESYMAKLAVLKNFVGSHEKSVDEKEENMNIKVLQVRNDLLQMKNELRLSLSSHWVIEDQQEKLKELLSLELNKAEQSKKELKNLSFRYLKGVLMLLALSFILPFIMMLIADYMRLKIGESSNGA